MNEQFETQNPVENTVTPANQMETPTPEAPKKKGNKISIIAGRSFVVERVTTMNKGELRAWQQQWLSRAALAYLQRSKQELF